MQDTLVDSFRGDSVLSDIDIINATLNTEVWGEASYQKDFCNLEAGEIIEYFKETNSQKTLRNH